MDIHEQLNAGTSNLQAKNAITIYRSKKKIWGLLIRSFCVIGLIVLAMCVAFQQNEYNDRWSGIFGAIFCVSVAVLVIVSVSPKLKETNPAIILDEKGITWTMHANEPLLIRWENISGLRSVSYKAMNFLVVEVNNSYHLKQGRKGMQSFFMQMNEIIFGSPICFRASTLEMNFGKLNLTFSNALANWKKRK